MSPVPGPGPNPSPKPIPKQDLKRRRVDAKAQKPGSPITGTKYFPYESKMADMSMEELMNLPRLQDITYRKSDGGVWYMGMTYTDGQTVGCGL